MRPLSVAPSPPDNLADPSEAEDVVHDLFVGLPEALGRYDERGSFAPWLHRVAVRLGLSRLWTQKRRSELGLTGEQ
jgi:DNA-directed RNA polymerase specialized sigma24 family protein